ncbi:hypothetical protein [Radiobacillus sp. PE A8.2]|uniref:hypothetical protein n=1 Tax=Radiobacillus sp. PE A8.2 TaxID=3380349 RepID=UPI0038910708
MLDEKLWKELEEYLHFHLNSITYEEELEVSYSLKSNISEDEIEEFIQTNRKPTLNHVLFTFIDCKGYKDSEVYKKAQIDRRHFSKIRSNVDYTPSKNTVVALVMALELSIDDTTTLLNSAGFSLSDNDTTDLVVRFCIEKKIYNIDLLNQFLDHFGQKPLIGTNE